MIDLDGDGADALAEPRLDLTRSDDPGDEVERNFRYQHQYGVVLLVAVRRGDFPYVTIYCEQHEDLLCERPDGLFDGWQIKTSTPENGSWTLRHAALVKSIGRFVDLCTTYPSQVGVLHFVSNSDFDVVGDDVQDQRRRGRCPQPMLTHLRSCASLADIVPPFLAAFEELGATLGADRQQLFDVLRRVELVKGPSRAEFDAALAHEHLGQLNDCNALTPGQLSELRDDLVARVHRAASLHVTDPGRHTRSLLAEDGEDPVITAKRIVCAEVVFAPPTIALKAFAYQGKPRLAPGGPRRAGVLEQKLKAGGLADAVGYMTAKEMAAEYALLEDQARNPVAAEQHLKQIEEAVHGECVEAFYASASEDQVFGPAMLTSVTGRLRRLEGDRRTLTGGQPYEVLVGVAAMLTRECRVWWSKRFDVQEPQP